MFIPTKVLQILLLLLVKHCINGESQMPVQPLLRLNNIVTDRINNMLKQHQNLKKLSANGELLQHYQRLTWAATLPIDQLDEKIRVYSSFRDYNEKLRQNLQQVHNGTEKSDHDLKQYDKEDLQNNKVQQRLDDNVQISDGESSEIIRQVMPPNSNDLSAFETRVINLLQRLGVYDRFTERVFQAIFSNEKLLRMLKEKLKKLDDNDKEKDKNHDCCVWDLIFGLF